MKKKMRKTGLILLALVLLIACIPANAFAAEIEDQYSDEGINWTLDSDGLLTIGGTNDSHYSFDARVKYKTKSVVFQSGVEYILANQFENFSYMEQVTIPDTVTFIGSYGFSSCKSLKEVKIPSTMDLLREGIFYNCTSLSKVTLPSGLYTIGNYLFYGCSSLKSVIIPSKVSDLRGGCFTDSGLETIWLPASVRRIEYGAFYDCNLKDVYYAGTEEQWNKIDISGGNEKLTGAAIHFNQEPPATPFTDVKDDAYYVEPVKWAVDHNITKGTSDTTFSPDTSCTRAQVVTFLWRAAGQPEATSSVNPFSDVKESDYFYKPVLWAVENGITSGISAAKFGADDPCSRAQVVTFQHRMAGKPKPKSSVNPFTDVKADAYYNKAVLWAVENGITSGISATAFGPDESCTRAQIVTFLYRQFV